MDDTYTYNRNRWRALVQANAVFTRPYLDLTEAQARERLDVDEQLGDVTGKDVLCLAGGGGQQSAAFALLGARVTVFDLSPEQLERDLSPADWDGRGYALRFPYQDGVEIVHPDQDWVHSGDVTIPPPREFRHTLGTLLNGLVGAGFELRHFSDTADCYPNPSAQPGTAEHFTAYAPPWLAFWATAA